MMKCLVAFLHKTLFHERETEREINRERERRTGNEFIVSETDERERKREQERQIKSETLVRVHKYWCCLVSLPSSLSLFLSLS
jgi:hypothetical protein